MNKKLLIFSLLIVSSFIFSGCALTSEKKVNQLQDKIQEEKQEKPVIKDNNSDEELKKEIEKNTDFSLDQNFSEMESVLR